MRHIILAVAIVAALSACGRRNMVEHPEGVKTDYPRVYPAR